MNLFKLLPVVAVVGVLMAATAAVATVQPINDNHNLAAEGEQDARACNGFEVEYGQDNGHVDRVKLHFDAVSGANPLNGGACQDSAINVEIHGPAHQIMGSCFAFIPAAAGTSWDCDLVSPIPNQPAGPINVANIDHINVVVTDLQ